MTEVQYTRTLERGAADRLLPRAAAEREDQGEMAASPKDVSFDLGNDRPSSQTTATAAAAARARVKWDEEVIKEHDKLRGTRQKIDEPDTPYEGQYEDSEEEEDSVPGAGDVNWGSAEPKAGPAPQQQQQQQGALDGAVLAARLGAAAAASTTPDAAKGSKKNDFKAARKAHYNEFEMLKRFREQQAMEDDDEDDEG